MPFGKRSLAPLASDLGAWATSYDKKSPSFQREFLHFGKRAPNGFQRDFMAFGKKRAPAPVLSARAFDRDFLAFGRKRK